MKHLVIRNFGPVKEVDIKLKRVNLIIGPQSSGKSTVLKVACFCDWMERQIELTQKPWEYCNHNAVLSNLIEFHKLLGYMNPDTFISYENDAVAFSYSAKDKECKFEWRNDRKWNYQRVKIAYIPAERNIVATIPNWYQISMKNDNVLDFMKQWEFARKAFVQGEQIMGLPVKYSYSPGDMGDRLSLTNGKGIDLTVVSSGLQSLTPLYIVLRYLTSFYFKENHTSVEQNMLSENLLNVISEECPNQSLQQQLDIVERIMTPHHTDFFIEEPEAHLFPSTQKTFIYSLVEMLNGRKNHACFIATHSPYIMTSFNNVILAGEASKESVEKSDAVGRLIPRQQTLTFDEVAAFEINNGSIRSIMDDEFRLISADAIDSASQEIANDFDYILNL